MAQLVENPPAVRETWVQLPGLGRSPGEEKVCPLQYAGLENSVDCIVHRVTESDMTERLSLSLWVCGCVEHLGAPNDPVTGRKMSLAVE